MVLATGRHGCIWHVLCWAQEMGSLPVAHSHGVPVDSVRHSDRDIWVHCRRSVLYFCLCS